MDIIGQQAQRERQCHIGDALVRSCAIDTDACGKSDHENGDHESSPRDALLRKGTYIFAVGIAPISRIGGDNGELIGALVAGIEELIGAGAAPQKRMILPKAYGRRPAIEALQVGSVGRDIRNRFHLTRQIVGGILVVFPQFIEHIGLIDEKDAHENAEADHHPFHLHAHPHSHIDGYDSQDAEPRRTAIGEEQAHEEQAEDAEEEKFGPAFAVAAEDKIERRRKE